MPYKIINAIAAQHTAKGDGKEVHTIDIKIGMERNFVQKWQGQNKHCKHVKRVRGQAQ